MDVKLVKAFLGKTVYYDTGQINFEGCRRGGRAVKTRTNFKRRQKGYFLAFFCVRIGCNVTLLKRSWPIQPAKNRYISFHLKKS